MAQIASDALMAEAQFKFGLVMVELIAAPGIRLVTVFTFFPKFSVMRIFFLVAINTL